MARSGLYRSYTALDSLDDRGAEWSPAEDAWPACTVPLRHLAATARDLARTTGCWSLGQATAYILTGETPQLSKLQLWTNRIPTDQDIPGGGLRYTIQVQGAVTREEWLRLRRVLLEHSGRERARPKKEDKTVVRFLGPKLNGRNLRPEFKGQAVLEDWNREYPERRFKTYQSLRNAYTRASKRLGRSDAS